MRISRSGIRCALLVMLMLSCLSWSGCVRLGPRVQVISSDQVETFVKGGQNFAAPCDGVFMPEARYQRYRRAVSDAILEERR